MLPLIILACLSAVRSFYEVPNDIAKGRAMARAGYRPDVVSGCLTVLMVPVLLGLWWWYALTTGPILLGIIPSIAATSAVLAVLLENLAKKAEEAK